MAEQEKILQNVNENDLEQVSGGNAPHDGGWPPEFELESRVLMRGEYPLPCPNCGADFMYVAKGYYKGVHSWWCAWCATINPLND
ncbi:MAG: hypothetical protein IJG15_08310 [Lachnospiraceae bacterium]|nr:hypothetical protein [Lachnospiraceae bacterium]